MERGGGSTRRRMGRKLGGPLACHWPATGPRGPATRLAAQGLLHRALAQLKGAAMIADWQQAALRAWPGRSVCLHVYDPSKRQPSKLDGEAESTLLQRASRGVAFIDSSPCLGLQAQQRLKTTISLYRDRRETYYILPPKAPKLPAWTAAANIFYAISLVTSLFSHSYLHFHPPPSILASTLPSSWAV